MPGELRNFVYRHAFTASASNIIRFSLGATCGIRQQIAVNLSATCKLIEREATTVLYSDCTFRIDLYNAQREEDLRGYGQSADEMIECERLREIRNADAVPGLLRALEAISTQTPGLMKSFVFAHHAYWCLETHQMGNAALGNEPQVSIHLEFMQKVPYWKLEIWSYEEQHHCDAVRCKTRTCTKIVPYFKAVLDGRKLKTLSKADIRDFAPYITESLWTSEAEGIL